MTSDKYGELAQDYCEHHSLPHESGYVLFWRGEPFAWSSALRPEMFVPGVVACSADGFLLLLATGGNADDGAREFRSYDSEAS
ncbi:MAG: hypothetical protein HYV96_00895 [Opitutae bacterium]|nr:hypothetical protein [Opitutae bacterium]